MELLPLLYALLAALTGISADGGPVLTDRRVAQVAAAVAPAAAAVRERQGRPVAIAFVSADSLSSAAAPLGWFLTTEPRIPATPLVQFPGRRRE